MLSRINKTTGNDRGIATEYVLLIVVIALAIVAGMGVLATNLNGAFGQAGTTLSTQVNS